MLSHLCLNTLFCFHCYFKFVTLCFMSLVNCLLGSDKRTDGGMNRWENSNPLLEMIPRMCIRVHTKLVTGFWEREGEQEPGEAPGTLFPLSFFFFIYQECTFVLCIIKYNFTTVTILRSQKYTVLTRSLLFASTVLSSLYVLIFSVTIFDTIISLFKNEETESQRLNTIFKITISKN